MDRISLHCPVNTNVMFSKQMQNREIYCFLQNNIDDASRFVFLSLLSPPLLEMTLLGHAVLHQITVTCRLLGKK